MSYNFEHFLNLDLFKNVRIKTVRIIHSFTSYVKINDTKSFYNVWILTFTKKVTQPILYTTLIQWKNWNGFFSNGKHVKFHSFYKWIFYFNYNIIYKLSSINILKTIIHFLFSQYCNIIQTYSTMKPPKQ